MPTPRPDQGQPTMTPAPPGPASHHAAASSGEGQQPLDRLLKHLGIMAHPWRALVFQAAMCAAAAGAGLALRLWAGAGLRLVAGLPVAAAGGIGAALVIIALLPRRRPARPQQPAPPWGAAAAAADAALPAAVLAAERHSLTGFAARTGRRSASVHVALCQRPARYPGLCQTVLILHHGGHLLAVFGEHVLPVAAAPLTHELAHLTGWRHQLARAALLARLAGWLLAGWLAGWPWLLAAGAAVQVVTMLAAWTVEVGCDRQAARQHGSAAVITALNSGQCPAARMPRWEQRLSTTLEYVTGLAVHPPVRARCLILRTHPTQPPHPHHSSQ